MLLYIWLGIMVLLLVIEALTLTLTTIWFAAGALVAAGATLLGVNLTTQIIVFLCVSLVLLIVTRPLALRHARTEVTKTNAAGMVGRKAIVIEEIDNREQKGRVKVGDIEWMARSADDALKLEIGEVVRVTAVTGAHLTVKRG